MTLSGYRELKKYKSFKKEIMISITKMLHRYPSAGWKFVRNIKAIVYSHDPIII